MPMPDVTQDRSSRRVLEPSERISEALFSLIMVLTFTSAISVANAGDDEVHTMLLSALGCNLAWGFIDAVLYLMSSKAERAATMRFCAPCAKPRIQRTPPASSPAGCRRRLRPFSNRRNLPPFTERLIKLPEPPAHARLHKDDWLGAGAVFLWVSSPRYPWRSVRFHAEPGPRPARLPRDCHPAAIRAGLCVRSLRWAQPWLRGIGLVILGGALATLAKSLGG